MLIYDCPETKLLVRTSIDTSKEVLQRLGTFKLSLWCPHCQTGHKVIAAEVAIQTERPSVMH